MRQAQQIIVGLQRQHEQRVSGRARVGMAFGPAPILFRAAAAWAEQSGRRVAVWRGGGLVAAMAAIGCTFGSGPDAKHAALRFVMPHHSTLGMPRWEDVPVPQQLSALAASCPPGDKREVLEHLLSHSHLPAQFWSASRLAALIEIRGSEALPLLFGWLESFDPTSLGWIAELVQLAPALPILIAAPVAGRTNLDTFASEGDRSGVLLHEGLIVVAQEVASPSPAVDDKRNTSEDRSRALVEAERPDAVDLHTLALAEAKSGRKLATGRYGSAAEAFLAQMLDAHPLTAGLFEPQGEPGFAMQGGQSARIDFLAANLRIAIEVDGPHHFEAIQYRRDRHKDLELQSRGYVVLRFLAEDVAADFERVRATINRTVLARARNEADFGV